MEGDKKCRYQYPDPEHKVIWCFKGERDGKLCEKEKCKKAKSEK